MSNDILKQIGVGLGNGLATSFSVLGAVNFIGMPVSYMANRFIYHSKGMRILLSLVAAVLSVPLVLGMIIYQLFTWGNGLQKAHYFGYMPFIIKSKTAAEEKAELENMSWIESLVAPIWAFIRDVLFGGFVDHREEADDKIAFEKAAEAILVPIEDKDDPTKVILEKVMALAQKAAQAATKDKSLEFEQEALILLQGRSSAPPQEQEMSETDAIEIQKAMASAWRQPRGQGD